MDIAPEGVGTYQLLYQWVFPAATSVRIVQPDQTMVNVGVLLEDGQYRAWDSLTGVFIEFYRPGRTGDRTRVGWSMKIYADLTMERVHDRIAAIGLVYDPRLSRTPSKGRAAVLGYLSVTDEHQPLRFIQGRRILHTLEMPYEVQLTNNLNIAFKTDASFGKFQLSKLKPTTTEEGSMIFHKYKAIIYLDLALRPIPLPTDYDKEYAKGALRRLETLREIDAPHRQELVKMLKERLSFLNSYVGCGPLPRGKRVLEQIDLPVAYGAPDEPPRREEGSNYAPPRLEQSGGWSARRSHNRFDQPRWGTAEKRESPISAKR